MWVRLDDKLPHHPKLVRAGGRAGWMFVAGLCYANEHATGGHIPTATLRWLTDERNAAALAAKLVEVGLWHPVAGGWDIHDYANYQPTGATESRAELSAARAEAGRRGGISSGNARRAGSNLLHRQKQSEEATGEQDGSPVPVPDPGPAPEPQESVPRGTNITPLRVSRESLNELWKKKTGLKGLAVPGLQPAADLLDAYAHEIGRVDVLQLADEVLDVLSRYCDTRSPGYRPQKDGYALVKHWGRLQPVIEKREPLDVEPAKPSDAPAIVAGLSFKPKGDA